MSDSLSPDAPPPGSPPRPEGGTGAPAHDPGAPQHTPEAHVLEAAPYVFWRGSREAHAKLNLTLEVCSLEPSGFHSIRSVMVPVDLKDTVILRAHYSDHPLESTAVTLTVHPPAPEVPTDASNLVVRAAHAVLAHWPADQVRPERLELTLEKAIPTQAGLGGGSADAAATLHLLDSLTRHAIARDTLASIAAQLGSDVPFACLGSAALCEGRGERLAPLVAKPLWIVLVRPPLAISTPWCYQRFDAMHLAPDRQTSRSGLPPAAPATVLEALCAALAQGDAAGAGRSLFNDLQSPVLDAHPHLHDLLGTLLEAGCVGAQMTGSGSCFFGVAPSRQAARRAAAAVTARGLGKVWVTRTHGSP